MFDIKIFDKMTCEEKLQNMNLMLKGLVSDNSDKEITKLCNAAAVINALIDKINWCGFYIAKDNYLYLGPFQGMPACTKIEIGKGVCGLAAQKRETVLVLNVHEFEGHIACDAASNSEIVVPIIKDNSLLAVLDIDSNEFSRFTELEKKYLEEASKIISDNIDFDNII